MQKNRSFPSAVDDALRCLPVELSRLIIDYLNEMPHEWTSFEEVDVVPTIGNEYEIRSFDRSVSNNRWRLLVSSNCFRTGDARWSIDLPIGRWQRNGRIGIGVTTAAGNNSFTDRHPSSELNWMLFFRNYDYLAYVGEVMHNGLILEDNVFYESSNTTDFRVEFRADMVVGSVYAYVSRKINGQYRRHADPIWILRSSTVTDSSRLRPCVALAGQLSIAVRSG